MNLEIRRLRQEIAQSEAEEDDEADRIEEEELTALREKAEMAELAEENEEYTLQLLRASLLIPTSEEIHEAFRAVNNINLPLLRSLVNRNNYNYYVETTRFRSDVTGITHVFTQSLFEIFIRQIITEGYAVERDTLIKNMFKFLIDECGADPHEMDTVRCPHDDTPEQEKNFRFLYKFAGIPFVPSSELIKNGDETDEADDA